MSNEMDESAVVELTGKIMMVAVIVLFVVVIFVFFLHLYAKWFWYRTDHNLRQEIGAGHEELRAVQHGLDPSVLKSIPAVIFSAQDGIECAVCLSEVSDGEKGRLLPKCKHGFHVECIDMWFQSHSTCPICRNPLSNLLTADSSSSSVEEARIEIPAAEEEEEEEVPVSTAFPTNVLFWGNESQVSTFVAPELPSTSASTSRRDGEMVIEIPKQMNYKREEEEEEEDSKSPSRLSTATPTPTRMTSFKRLFISSSRDTRVNPTTTTPHVQQVAPN